MIGPHTQGRRGADHFALLGLTGVANRTSGDANEASTVRPGSFAAPVAAPLEEPVRAERQEEAIRREQHEDAAPRARQELQMDQAALRKYAATLLSDASEATKRSMKASTPPSTAQVQPQRAYTGSTDRVSPFTMAAMLMFAGLLFLFVIPPVGLTFLLCAVLPLIWGAGSTAVKSS